MKDYVYAGFWIRVGANFIDLIILLFSLSTLSVIFIFIFIFSNIFSGFIWILLQYLVPFVLTIWFWLRFQATPGKMATNIRVVEILSLRTRL